MDAGAPNYELALNDYQSGMKYREIAEKYGVTINTVKSWKTRYRWEKGKKKGVHTKAEKVCTQKGGQPGNKNAVGNKGGAAPRDNKNALKTGEFETLFFDTMDPEELRLAQMVQADKEQLLLQEIQLLTIRERRMLKRIEDIKGAIEQTVSGEEIPGMTVVKYQRGMENGNATDLKEYQGKLGQIQSIEDALTRVQGRKQSAIDSLHRFGIDDAKMSLELMKLELEMSKRDQSSTETVDDGFLDAMNVEAKEWSEDDE